GRRLSAIVGLGSSLGLGSLGLGSLGLGRIRPSRLRPDGLGPGRLDLRCVALDRRAAGRLLPGGLGRLFGLVPGLLAALGRLFLCTRLSAPAEPPGLSPFVLAGCRHLPFRSRLGGLRALGGPGQPPAKRTLAFARRRAGLLGSRGRLGLRSVFLAVLTALGALLLVAV